MWRILHVSGELIPVRLWLVLLHPQLLLPFRCDIHSFTASQEVMKTLQLADPESSTRYGYIAIIPNWTGF
jgi:hypothetical protein